jgi:branched-subunit amino acid aminotransferase/4-amino-4-deoxychorismate lyase
MKILFDGSIYPEAKAVLPVSDRGLQYGDGVFETMLMADGRIRNLSYHIERLRQGMKALKMEGELSESDITDKATSLARENGLNGLIRIKWVIWRKSGGLYTPASADIHEMVRASEYTPGLPEVKKADFAESAYLCYSAVSRFKTISALPYVIASIECREKGMDDMILLSGEGKVAECLYANLFWGTGKNLYTPSLLTGCIEGVRRRALLEHLPDMGYTITETTSHPEDLLMAAFAFRTNATSIVPLHRIADRTYRPVPEDILSLTDI